MIEGAHARRWSPTTPVPSYIYIYICSSAALWSVLDDSCRPLPVWSRVCGCAMRFTTCPTALYQYSSREKCRLVDQPTAKIAISNGSVVMCREEACLRRGHSVHRKFIARYHCQLTASKSSGFRVRVYCRTGFAQTTWVVRVMNRRYNGGAELFVIVSRWVVVQCIRLGDR